MIRVPLLRFETGDQGTFGRVQIPGGPSFFSGELPDRNNAANISCIPCGDFPARWTYSPRFRRFMYLIDGTDPRAGIRAHSANFMGDDTLGYRRQLNGCIALGERIGWMGGQKALLLSAPAVRRFEAAMAKQTFILEVRNA